jgi:hypothetical protein
MRSGWLLVVACALMLGGCSRRERNDDCAPNERVVDPVLLAFLSRARSAHHAADLREAQGDDVGALGALQTLAGGEAPPGHLPEVDEVLADTRARIADLLSRSAHFDQADAEISAGLERAPTPSYFRGHLFEVRGLVEERREKDLRAKGRGQEADQARERSLSAYEATMKIQADVIRSAGPARPAPGGAPAR